MSVLATDNFNRADSSDLGANWTPRNVADRNFKIVSNGVEPANLAGDCYEFYNAVAWPNDQFSQAVITVLSGSGDQAGVGVGVRIHSDSSIFTLYWHVANQHSTLGSSVAKLVSGTYTLIGQRDADWAVNDVIYLEVQGSTLIAKKNGSALGASMTDSAIASGNAGVTFSSTMTSSRIDDWEGGDFAAAHVSGKVNAMFLKSKLQGLV